MQSLFIMLVIALITPATISFLAPSPSFAPSMASRASSASSASSSSSSLASQVKFKSFDDMLASYKEPVLVDFHAVWCGPCQMMSKELTKVGDSMEGIVKIAKVDTDKYPNLGSKYNIDGLPTCVLFKNGQPVHRIVGMATSAQVKIELAPFLD